MAATREVSVRRGQGGPAATPGNDVAQSDLAGLGADTVGGNLGNLLELGQRFPSGNESSGAQLTDFGSGLCGAIDGLLLILVVRRWFAQRSARLANLQRIATIHGPAGCSQAAWQHRAVQSRPPQRIFVCSYLAQ